MQSEAEGQAGQHNIAASVILFDLGGVLLENSGFERLNCLISEPLEWSVMKGRWLASQAVRGFELGKISPAQFARAFIDEWQISLGEDEFLREFTAWPSGLYAGAAEMLQTLRRNYRVGCLSNSNCLHWERFNGFAGHFDITLSSHQMGAIKPDEEAFLSAVLACDTEPSAIWFFDDQPANVATARRLGIRARQVEGFAQLTTTLKFEGLLAT